MPLTPGTRLGPYEILAPLGAGGMGEVYRARDTRLGREVAIKALPAAFARDPERVARFEREAQALAALNHPNVAAIYGVEEAGGTLQLVLELVQGESLAERLGRGALPLREALTLGVQVAAAIEAAHERGIVHRDLKPGNVMLGEPGVAKVLDFGLAKNEVAPVESDSGATRTVGAAATEAGVILGTAAYMSPEQARGRAVDRRSDVWSFGCVLFECLAGRPAFAGETVTDLLARILEREPEWNALPAGTPQRVRDILRRCLQKDADARPRDIRDVRLELAELAGGPGRAAAAEQSIAVLPFENQSGPDDAYFADGVTDEILNALAQVDGLRVAARTSCFAFKGRRVESREVGETLGVTTVLEGTVRRAGQRLRITAQLVDAAGGFQLWSERYDRELTDVFAVQDEIAAAIATRLRGALHGGTGRARTHGTTNVEAYELLLKGRALQLQRRSFAQAISYFEQAIALDPDYAEAMASMADSYRLLGTMGLAPFGEVMPRARELAARVLERDPDNAEALTTLADVEGQYDRDLPRAMASWERALAADPRHVRARCERANWAQSFGAITAEFAVQECRRALADDPLNAWVGGMLAMVLGHAGRHEDALASARAAVAVDPDSFFPNWTLLRELVWFRDLDAAFALAKRLLASSDRHSWAMGMLGWAHERAGEPARSRAVFDELEARSRHEFVSPLWLAMTASFAGADDDAIRFLARAAAEREPLVLLVKLFPFGDRLRADPRFEETVRGVWG